MTVEALIAALGGLCGGWALGVAWADTRIEQLEAVLAAQDDDSLTALADIVCPRWQDQPEADPRGRR